MPEPVAHPDPEAAEIPSPRSWHRQRGREGRVEPRDPNGGERSKLNRGRSPHDRSTRLADASPSGISGEGKFGMPSAWVSSAVSISRRLASSRFTSSPEALRRVINSSAGSLARLRRATSSVAAFRSALIASVCTRSSRRWRSSSSTASTTARSEGSPRRARLARLPSGSWRSRFRSITGCQRLGRPGSRPLYPQLLSARTLNVTVLSAKLRISSLAYCGTPMAQKTRERTN